MAKRGARGQKYGIQPKPARDIRRRVYYHLIPQEIEILRMIGAQVKINDAVNNLSYEEQQEYRNIYEGLKKAIGGMRELERLMRENDPVNR